MLSDEVSNIIQYLKTNAVFRDDTSIAKDEYFNSIVKMLGT